MRSLFGPIRLGAIGAERTAVRRSPDGASEGVDDSAPNLVFPAAAAALSGLGIAFLELREVREPFPALREQRTTDLVRAAFKGPLVLNAGYDLASGAAVLAEGLHA